MVAFLNSNVTKIVTVTRCSDRHYQLESVENKFPKNRYLDLCSWNDGSKTNRFCDFSRQNIAIISDGIHD